VRRAVDDLRRRQDVGLERALRYIGAFEADPLLDPLDGHDAEGR
jgi:hypothetical protein